MDQRGTRTSTQRKLSMYGFELVEGSHNIFALLEFDITNLREHLREKRVAGEGGSLFAFFLKAIAKCLEENPIFNAMIDLRTTTIFENVDISVPVEITRDGEVYNKQHLICMANKKTIGEITKELEAAKKNEDGREGFILSTTMQKLLGWLPRRLVLRLFRLILRNHNKVMELSGSVFVTSVSMFSNVPGYIIPYIGGPKASSFAIGSTMKKPMVKANQIVIREMINITAVFNHDIIDGAPAARLINRLRRYIEVDYGKLIEKYI